MDGIDPYAYLQRVAGELGSMNDRRSLETTLDELEYLYEVIPPDLQVLADPLVETLRDRLKTQ